MFKSRFRRTTNGQYPTLTKLLRQRPIVLLDIGARGGLPPRWTRFTRYLDVVGFEPDAEECALLNRGGVDLTPRRRFLPYALWGTDGRMTFYVCKQAGCSSLYEPNTKFVSTFHFGPSLEVRRTLEVAVTTLQRVCDQEALRPDVMKIDAQGAELDILIGAGPVLDMARVVEVEVEFNAQYRAQPLFGDVDRFLRNRGFLLIGLRRTLWRRNASVDPRAGAAGGFLIHGDALYYNEQLLSSEAAWGSSDVAVFAVLLAAYRQNDFLLDLLRTPLPAARGLSVSERETLTAELVERPSLGAVFVGRVLDRLGHAKIRGAIDGLRHPSATDWHDPDFF
jgi:FkbM family methyltransferase